MIRESMVSTSAGPARVLEAGSGWPVVLLHAFPLSADMWRPQLEGVEDGWRIIAPDLRGFGPKAKTAATGQRTGMEDLATGALAVLDAMEIDRAVIGGLSMGGYVTFALYRLAPERFSGMVLADTRPQPDTPEGRAGRQKMLELVRRDGPAAVARDMMPKLLGDTTRRERPTVEPRVRQMIEANSTEGIAGAVEAMMDRPDSTPLLPRIPVPTFIVVGEEDRLTPPSDSEAMQRQITRSRLVVLPGAGHLANLETPETFSRALADFLTANL